LAARPNHVSPVTRNRLIPFWQRASIVGNRLNMHRRRTRPAQPGVRMTKFSLLFAMGLSAIAAPAFAQHVSQGGYAPMLGASDPCVLGSNAQPGACVGPVRVAPTIMSQGPVQLQPTFAPAPQPVFVPAPQPNYAQVPASPSPAPIQMSGCVPGYGAPSVPCHGVWVPAPSYAPQPAYAPAPQPAPIYMPAPVAYAPQPQQIGYIPTSFFTGGITYGAGFPTETGYTSGGGGFIYSGGGPRFSGVRERSPTPLVPPAPRPRHNPPPAHPPSCGHC
jgi:hypothetical protein